ncbi:MAG: hypothetical protein J0L93_04485 [Deltaproteobacteria bacterium]|nr:hypothetical protein [Deltaproteobacteria bacterium]
MGLVNRFSIVSLIILSSVAAKAFALEGKISRDDFLRSCGLTAARLAPEVPDPNAVYAHLYQGAFIRKADFGPRMELPQIQTAQYEASPFVYVTGTSGFSYGVFKPNEKFFGFKQPRTQVFNLPAEEGKILRALQFQGYGENLIGLIETPTGVELSSFRMIDQNTGEIKMNDAPAVKIQKKKYSDALKLLSRPNSPHLYLVNGKSEYTVIEASGEEIKINMNLKYSFKNPEQKFIFEEFAFFNDGASGYLRIKSPDGATGIAPVTIANQQTGELTIHWELATFFQKEIQPLAMKPHPTVRVIYVTFKDSYRVLVQDPESGQYTPLKTWRVPVENVNLRGIDFYPAIDQKGNVTPQPFFILNSTDGKSTQIMYGRNNF